MFFEKKSVLPTVGHSLSPFVVNDLLSPPFLEDQKGSNKLINRPIFKIPIFKYAISLNCRGTCFTLMLTSKVVKDLLSLQLGPLLVKTPLIQINQHVLYFVKHKGLYELTDEEGVCQSGLHLDQLAEAVLNYVFDIVYLNRDDNYCLQGVAVNFLEIDWLFLSPLERIRPLIYALVKLGGYCYHDHMIVLDRTMSPVDTKLPLAITAKNWPVGEQVPNSEYQLKNQYGHRFYYYWPKVNSPSKCPAILLDTCNDQAQNSFQFDTCDLLEKIELLTQSFNRQKQSAVNDTYVKSIDWLKALPAYKLHYETIDQIIGWMYRHAKNCP